MHNKLLVWCHSCSESLESLQQKSPQLLLPPPPSLCLHPSTPSFLFDTHQNENPVRALHMDPDIGTGTVSALPTLALFCRAFISDLASAIISSISFPGSEGSPKIGSLLDKLSWLCVFFRAPVVPARAFNCLIRNGLAGDAKKPSESAVPMIT